MASKAFAAISVSYTHLDVYKRQAFALAGCAKESVVDSALTNAGNAIGFNTYSNITRGNPFDNNPEFAASGNVFGVTAFISTSDSPYMGKADEMCIRDSIYPLRNCRP